MKNRLFLFVALIVLTSQNVAHSTPPVPILPYVFFEYNSAEIPSRYVHVTSVKINTKDIMDAYYSILNVLGSRLRQHPNAVVTLTGTNSNTENELNNTNLSHNRALAIRNYLIKNWKISPKQIIISVRNLPANPGNTFTKEGCEENRRVEISSEDPSILAPIITKTLLMSH
jgi:hypothetical protein